MASTTSQHQEALHQAGWARTLAAAAALCVGLVVAPAAAQPRTGVDWTDWQASGPGFVLGHLALGAGQSADVQFDGTVFTVFTGSFQDPYWGPANTYRGTRLANAPPNSDGIVIAGGNGPMRLSFSQPVVDPVLAIASLGLTTGSRSVNLAATMQFDQAFEVLSNGPNFYANGQFTNFVVNGNTLSGVESSGVIRFRGSFEELTWTSPLREENPPGVLQGTYLFSLGSAGCSGYELGPNPLVQASTVRAGCSAYTLGSFAQQARLDVRGSLEMLGAYTLHDTLEVAVGGRVEHATPLQVAATGRLRVLGTHLGGALAVYGQMDTLPGSSMTMSGLIVDSAAQVTHGGVASSSGPLSVNGVLRLQPGASLLAQSVLVGGSGSLLDIQSGAAGAAHLQASGGLFANSGATVRVGGALTILNTLELDQATLEVLSGGSLDGSLSGSLAGTFSNAGVVALAGSVVQATAAATLTNTGAWSMQGGLLSLGTGAVFTNSGQFGLLAGAQLHVAGGARIDNTGQLRVGPGATLLHAEGAQDLQMLAGRIDIDHGGTLEMSSGSRLSTGNAARIQNSGTIVLRTGTAFENGAQFVMQPGGRLEVDAGAHVITGGPRFEVAPGAEVLGAGFFEQVAGTTIINGSISLPLSVFSGGILQGSGVVFGNAVLGGTTQAGSVLFVGPGNSPGTLTFQGDVLANNVVFEIEAADFDRLDRVVVTGALTIGQATAQFRFGPDFRPDLNDSGRWLDATSATGLENLVHSFDAIADGWELQASQGSIAWWNPMASPLDQQVPFQLLPVYAGTLAYVDGPPYIATGPITVGGSLAIRPGSAFSTAHWLQVESGGRMTNRGVLVTSEVGLTNAGLLENRHDGLLVHAAGTLQNSGQFVNTGRLENSATVLNTAGGTFLQRGTLSNTAFGVVRNQGQLNLSGTLTQSDDALVENDGGQLHILPGGRIMGGRFMQVGAGAHTRVDGALDVLDLGVEGGVLSGTGRIGAPARFGGAAVGEAVLRPGAPDATTGAWGGVLGFGGPVVLDAGAVVEVLLAGPTAFGALQFDGVLWFEPGARLQFVFVDGFVPATDLLVPFLNFHPGAGLAGHDPVALTGNRILVRGVSGEDADWTGGSWNLAMRSDGIDLQLALAPVPEPGTWAMLLAGMVVLGARLRGCHPRAQTSRCA